LAEVLFPIASVRNLELLSPGIQRFPVGFGVEASYGQPIDLQLLPLI